MTLLEVRAASVTYQNRHRALHPTDIHVQAGELIVLLGPSGAGKSTLLRALNGLVPLEAGSVRAWGELLAEPRQWRMHRRRTGMVFQQHQLIGRLSALANVLTGRLAFHGSLRTLLPWPREDKRIALEALDRVGLLDCALQRADRLSGGQQQRVGIARALAQRPELLLADEPVASLDPATAEKVLDLVRDICRADGIAAIVSLHQVELARRFADRVIGVSAGRVVFEGPPQALDAEVLDRIYSPPRPATPGDAHESPNPARHPGLAAAPRRRRARELAVAGSEEAARRAAS